MRSLLIGAVALFSSSSFACEDVKTTNEIVNYVCDYALVSDTQCRIWKEDTRQMDNTRKIILNSFISWNDELRENKNMVVGN